MRKHDICNTHSYFTTIKMTDCKPCAYFGDIPNVPFVCLFISFFVGVFMCLLLWERCYTLCSLFDERDISHVTHGLMRQRRLVTSRFWGIYVIMISSFAAQNYMWYWSHSLRTNTRNCIQIFINRTNPLEYNLKRAFYPDCGIAVQGNVINLHPRAWQNMVGRVKLIFMSKW